jgi:hypothetical protein
MSRAHPFACKVRDEEEALAICIWQSHADGHRCHAAKRPTKRRESGAQTGGGHWGPRSLSPFSVFFSTLEQSLLHVGVGEADAQAVPVGRRHWRSDGRSSCCAWIFRDWMRKLVRASRSGLVVSPLFLRRSKVRFDGRVVLPVVRCVAGRSSSEAE